MEHCKAYRRRQAQAESDKINVVEIDLARSGQFDLIPRLERIEPLFGTVYAISIYRATRPGCVEIFPLRLRNRLPTIPIPLRSKDHEVTLNLQELIDQCYEHGRYFKLDYQRPLDPPLRKEDEDWARELIGAWLTKRTGA